MRSVFEDGGREGERLFPAPYGNPYVAVTDSFARVVLFDVSYASWSSYIDNESRVNLKEFIGIEVCDIAFSSWMKSITWEIIIFRRELDKLDEFGKDIEMLDVHGLRLRLTQKIKAI